MPQLVPQLLVGVLVPLVRVLQLHAGVRVPQLRAAAL